MSTMRYAMGAIPYRMGLRMFDEAHSSYSWLCRSLVPFPLIYTPTLSFAPRSLCQSTVHF